MAKKQGWEIRLSKFIDQKRNEPFKRGFHDCALFAGDCIDLMTGSDTTTEFRQPYKTKKEAYEMLKNMGYDGLEAVANAKLGSSLLAPTFAQRGDCVLIEFEGEEALGIVDLSGKQAVTVGKSGLSYYKMQFWKKAWAV